MGKDVNERKTCGGATDGAVLKYAANIIEISQIHNEFTKLATVPFNSKNKWMACVFKKNENCDPIVPSPVNQAEFFEAPKNYYDCFDFDFNKGKCVAVVAKGKLYFQVKLLLISMHIVQIISFDQNMHVLLSCAVQLIYFL